MADYVYVLKNETMQGLVKIGFTTRPPEQRVAELSSSSGVPMSFAVIHARPVSDGRAAEQAVHRFLDKYRVSREREFFRLPVEKAIAGVDFVCADFPPHPPEGAVGIVADTSLERELLELLRSGKKIDAIKLYRSRSSVGLREAKESVEELAWKAGLSDHKPIQRKAGTGCAGLPVAGLALSAFLSVVVARSVGRASTLKHRLRACFGR